MVTQTDQSISDPLPEWAQALVQEAKLWRDDRIFRFLTQHNRPSRYRELSESHRIQLYKLAQATAKKRARKLFYHLRAGKCEYATELHQLLGRFRQNGAGLDEELGLSTQDLNWIKFMSKLADYKGPYNKALAGDGYSRRQLLERLSSTGSPEPWEFDADPAQITEWARELTLTTPLVATVIEECRAGDVWRVDVLQRAMQPFGLGPSDLGLKDGQLETWQRQARRDHIASKFSFGFEADDTTLYMNIWGALAGMIKHRIPPEEAGITRKQLNQARERLQRYCDSERRRESHSNKWDHQDAKKAVADFEKSVYPLFEQVLAMPEPGH